ncbi:probable translation initiation factor eIF-2B subunit delta [Selaginella moellendorffii]|uniref:probable translation initiation factor eIF-2B subunit delta n=1 Tax=Selaginella moellendorffii TaxID=88036 RepID=UPI000D1C7A11|nr:probable translation initiation factor eIF-2B subunit delta [Selaginella moellendorffii]|eukprot:XP_024527590.1 probable translation initiation factor eIF-2B subunit delta [Selaginella moellendorffii]
MESGGGARRGRTVIDPKVRQVGFVTPGEQDGPAGVSSSSAQVNAPDSPAPVMIPPAPRVAVPAAADHSPPKPAAPVPIPPRSPPLPPRNFDAEDEMPLGSYNPGGEGVLAGSPNSSYGKASSEKAEIGDLSPTMVAELNSSMMEMSLERSKYELPVPEKENESTADVISERVEVPAINNNEGPENDARQRKLKDRTSKAERRALQESQRAAKEAARASAAVAKAKAPPQKKDGSNEKKGVDKKPVDKRGEKDKKKEVVVPEKDKRKDAPAPRLQFDDEQKVAKARRRAIVEQTTETKHRVELFRHLPQFVPATQLQALEEKYLQNDTMHIHPAVYQVGLKYLTWDIVGGNARCVAMLEAFKEMIRDYTTPPQKVMSRDLTAKINSHVSFLSTCRPLSISMGNAIRSFKLKIGKLRDTLTEAEAKSSLVSHLETFAQEKIILADKEIVKHAVTKIIDGDVVLTHGFSCVVEMVLSHAHSIGKKFRVVVMDSRPRLEGRILLRSLLAQGVQCTYTHINAVTYIMQEVTKVFLGAASILANGTVYSRVGTAAAAMVAHGYRVPVMICCETYKFHERVQLDSICSNELGDPDALVGVAGRKEFRELVGWDGSEHLRLLNLTYDATPADYVSMIITEHGMVPPTSVPVILREYRKEPIL